ncbi:MAG: lytic transglycosylase domain-containing protein [bacterium]
MRPLLAAIATLAALATPAAADMCVVKERDGTTTVTSDCGRRGARVLYRETRRGADTPAAARPPPPPAPNPTDLAERARRYAAHVSAAAAHYALPEALVWAVMKTESNFQPEVVSHRGAQGLMQLMPDTAGDMGVTDAFDPEQNIFGGARFLRILANKFDGDLVKTLAGYHAGGGAVSLTNGIPYEQTAEYVRRVLNHYYAYQKRLPTE